MTDNPEQGEMPEKREGEMPKDDQIQSEMLEGEFDATRAMATIETQRKMERQLKSELAKAQKALEKLEAKEKERQEAELSEMEKLQKKIADMEAERDRTQKEMRTTRIKSAVIAKASEMNFHDPEDAYRLIDTSLLDINEEDKIEGVEESLKALKESKPYMIKGAKPKIEPTHPGENITGQGETDDQRRARLFRGSPQNLFTPESARQHGGGVVEKEI